MSFEGEGIMEYISLLWPQDDRLYLSKMKCLKDGAVDSLGVEALCKSLSRSRDEVQYLKKIIINMCSDEEVIKYRQEVFQDIMSSKTMMLSLQDILSKLEFLKSMGNDHSMFQDANLWKFFSRFKELDSYIDCISSVAEVFRKEKFNSVGLNSLKDMVVKISESDEFKIMSKNIEKLSLELNEIQSLTLGVNLDSSLNPVEAMLISVNNTRFKENSFLRNFFSKKDMDLGDVGISSRIHSIGQDPRHPIMYHLGQDIESILKPVIRDMTKILKKYANLNGYFLVKLIPEITFYIRFIELFNFLKENNMPVCIPRVMSMEERKCVIENVYNVNLSLHLLKKNIDASQEIVLNDVNFDEQGRIFILTGPNRGGKTVYTEAIGLAQILFQSGVFIPGTEACISPIDSIYTHFPVDENQTVELGRLGEEAKRLNEIFTESTKYSIILLNESLASTSNTEGLYIAQDVVKSLRYLGAKAVFNTHMHELAASAEGINEEINGESKVVSLVTGIVEGKRSYKIYKGDPHGRSYAKDIAFKHGISFEQLAEIINRK
jgi:DNA mismatch repair protein MutS